MPKKTETKWKSPATAQNGFAVLDHACRLIAVPERLSLPDWADAHRKLSRKNAARFGDWKTSTVEIARGPMLAVDEPGVETISLMVATQTLKTELLLNTAARLIHLDPCPILVVYPNEDAAQAFSKERLTPMISETPVLRDLVGNPRSRKSENTIEVKHFPGGFVAMVSAGSPMNLKARPVRITICDEVDDFAPTRDGDPILLAEERTATYDELGLSLHLRAGSPTGEETSRIWASYQLSDMRKPYVACPYCKHWQYLEFFRHVHWPKNAGVHDTSIAAVFCEMPECNKAWTERQRRDALRNIKWYQTKTFVCCGRGQDPRVNRSWEWVEERKCGYALCVDCGRRAVSNAHAGFTASKLYSPHITIPKLAGKWIEAEKDIESKRTFYNTQLALPYKIDATKIVAAKDIAARRETWANVPNEVCVITVGVDVHPGGQDNIGRLEYEVVGWSENEESWSLKFDVVRGDPAQTEVWKDLDDILLEPLQREDGRKMKILAACIDSGGHNTEEVYKFCLHRAARNVWAIKGASDRLGQWSPVWPAREQNRTKHRRRVTRHRYRPVVIGVNAGKEAIRQRLLIKEPGPGYCHFPAGRPAGYFDQLASERLIIERRAGMIIRRWDLPSHLANEALDVRVYAYAALQGLINDRGFKPSRVARMLAREPAEEAEAGGMVQIPEPIHPDPVLIAPPQPLPAVAALPPPVPALAPAPIPPARASSMAIRGRRAVITRSNFMLRRSYY